MLWRLLAPLAPDDRYSAIVDAVSFQPSANWDPVDLIGRVRAAVAGVWESTTGQVVPVKALAAIMSSDDGSFRIQIWAASKSSDIEGFATAVRILIGIVRPLCETRADRDRVHSADGTLPHSTEQRSKSIQLIQTR